MPGGQRPRGEPAVVGLLVSGVVGGAAWAAVQASAAEVRRRLRPHRVLDRLEARALALDCLRHHYGTGLAVEVIGETRGADGTWKIDLEDQGGSASYSVDVPVNPGGPETLEYHWAPRAVNP
jgi:hypothetical protein